MEVRAVEHRRVEVTVKPLDALVAIGDELGVNINNISIRDGKAYAKKNIYFSAEEYVVHGGTEKFELIKALLLIKENLKGL